MEVGTDDDVEMDDDNSFESLLNANIVVDVPDMIDEEVELNTSDIDCIITAADRLCLDVLELHTGEKGYNEQLFMQALQDATFKVTQALMPISTTPTFTFVLARLGSSSGSTFFGEPFVGGLNFIWHAQRRSTVKY